MLASCEFFFLLAMAAVTVHIFLCVVSQVTDVSYSSQASQAEVQAFVDQRTQSREDGELWEKTWFENQMKLLEDEYTSQWPFQVLIGKNWCLLKGKSSHLLF